MYAHYFHLCFVLMLTLINQQESYYGRSVVLADRDMVEQSSGNIPWDREV